MFIDLIEKTRTVRHFNRKKPVTGEDILYLLECARLTPCAANLQRIRYASFLDAADPKHFAKVAFAGYLPEDKKPKIDEAPTAYLVILTACDTPDVNLSIDIGIAAEAIVIAARDKGIGACMIRSFDKEYFTDLVSDTGYKPQLVIALGYPAEEARIVECVDGNVKYYKDEKNVNCVPKLPIEELLVK